MQMRSSIEATRTLNGPSGISSASRSRSRKPGRARRGGQDVERSGSRGELEGIAERESLRVEKERKVIRAAKSRSELLERWSQALQVLLVARVTDVDVSQAHQAADDLLH